MADAQNKQTGELFIVDNSDAEWKAQKYLYDWCDIAKSFDIATGYFEIGSLLSLDGQWQKLDHIRILMGDEVSKRTRSVFQQMEQGMKNRLEQSMEQEKGKNDFLSGVPAIVQALQAGKIQCRVYRKNKFHAKAYITHAKQEVVGSIALVGSSNFTVPGLTDNVELNIRVRSEVDRLQQWYDAHWQDAEDVTPDILKIVERHIREYSPFEVYLKSLHEYFRNHELTASEWERDRSKIYTPVLAQYQREGYQAIMKIANSYGGAFLCDGVGLGKTFIGLMILERLLDHDLKNVVLLVPKAARASVWEAKIKKHLPTALNNPFVQLEIINHTDLLRQPSEDIDWPAKLKQITEHADAIIIDEAHTFRNRSSRRYRELKKIISNGKKRKQVFLLTATPVNNSLLDLQHQIELFTGDDEKYFSAAPLAIHSIPGHFRKLENELEKIIEADAKGKVYIDMTTGQTSVLDEPQDLFTQEIAAQQVLINDSLFKEIVVQRSRDYVMKSTKMAEGEKVMFPKREDPQVGKYSLKKVYGPLLDKIDTAFNKQKPLLILAVYSPYDPAYFKGDASKLDKFILGRQLIVSLVRVMILKRFESSIAAFKFSCENLIITLLSFVERHRPSEAEKWKTKNAGMLRDIIKERIDEEDLDDDILPEEFIRPWVTLSEEEHRIDLMVKHTLSDLELLKEFLDDTNKLRPENDDKLQSLITLMQTDKDLKKQKVLLFTEFVNTAKYIQKHLTAAGIDSIAEVDSTYKGDRGSIIKRFSPYYNETTSAELKKNGDSEIRVLISTDVLSEGLNLQDASLIINYDLHWNPVRLMQRIGRVDRRLDEKIEKQMIADHPELSSVRGKVRLWNFLPPDELNQLLSLYKKVTKKTLRISKVFGIEGKKLLTGNDNYDALRDFNAAYEGKSTPQEELQLKYQGLLRSNPDVAAALDGLPLKLFSGKEHPQKGVRAVFFCYALPGQNRADEQWSLAHGITKWYLYDMAGRGVSEDTIAIDAHISCVPGTPRIVCEDPERLVEIRKTVEKHIHDSYMKRSQVPLNDSNDNPLKPVLLAWMELS
ncbi:MAG: helicase-related protein [Spirochaetota bacterium]